MKNRTHVPNEREMEMAKLVMADCKTTGDVQAKLKRLFAGLIEQMLEAEMDDKFNIPENKKSAVHSPPDTQQLQIRSLQGQKRDLR